MLLDELLAEEVDRADVVERRRVDDRWNESVAGVAEDEQRAVTDFDRLEEAGLRVRERVQFAGRELVAKMLETPV